MMKKSVISALLRDAGKNIYFETGPEGPAYIMDARATWIIRVSLADLEAFQAKAKNATPRAGLREKYEKETPAAHRDGVSVYRSAVLIQRFNGCTGFLLEAGEATPRAAVNAEKLEAFEPVIIRARSAALPVFVSGEGYNGILCPVYCGRGHGYRATDLSELSAVRTFLGGEA